ncbi:MAG: bifunctional adenosylcobinamide kinase/adenosylcobinamide-phosphate guanylyltransferase [Acidimicrobiia bacterium]
MPYVFVTGGARSGKSSAAERRATAARAGVTVVATAEAGDEEMAARIDRHRAARPRSWETVEEPVALTAALRTVAEEHFVIVDCLTLWLANVLGSSDGDIVDQAREAIGVLVRREGDGMVVSNEVGDGIVPADPMIRRYRDLLGQVNSLFAASATDSYLMVAGRALALPAAPW